MLLMKWRSLKPLLLGGALAGAGYGLINLAAVASNSAVSLASLATGLAALILGIRMLWIGWKKSSEEDEEKRKPPSIL